MPPKKRGRPAKKAADVTTAPAPAPAPASDEDSEVPPPKKRGRPAKKVADAAAAPPPISVSDDDNEPPPPKKRGRPARKAADVTPAPAPIIASDDDNEPSQAKKAKASAKAKATTTKGKGKQRKVEESPEPEQDDQVSTKKDDLFQKPVKKQEKDAQVARDQNLSIPVDEGCPYANSHRVYIDEEGVIYDASLNQTNVGGNNNKFYRIQILERKGTGGDFQTWTRWGRVGERGQSKSISCDSFDYAFREFNKKFKDKSGYQWEDRHKPAKANKYTFIERSYEPDTSSEDDEKLPGAGDRRGSKQSTSSNGPPSQLELPVQQLMQLIFNQQYFKEVMADMAYDLNKLPLGKLSKRTLEQGYEHLKALAEVILNLDLDPATIASDNQTKVELSNMYFSTIPHNFGRNRPQPISNEEQLKREIALLESLSDMKIAEDIMKEAKSKSQSDVHPLDRQYAGLGMAEMTALDPKTTEYEELSNYLQNTRGATHSIKYKIEDIFRIERNGEYARFESSEFGKMAADRRLLWHGSRTTNFGGILSQGLRIAPPEAPVSGYMFGKGVYLADMSSKSANYCYHHASGNVGLLLLCEAELGKPILELTDSDYNAGERAKEQGSYSTWGKGVTAPPKWKDAGCVNENLKGVTMPDVSVQPGNTNVPGAYLQYNEFIVYDVSQIRLRYLFRVNMSHGY